MRVLHHNRSAAGVYRTFECELHGRWCSSPLDPLLRKPGERPTGWQGQPDQSKYADLREQLAVSARKALKAANKARKVAAQVRAAEDEARRLAPELKKQARAEKKRQAEEEKAREREALAPARREAHLKQLADARAKKKPKAQPVDHAWRPKAKKAAKVATPKPTPRPAAPVTVEPAKPSARSRIEDIQLARSLGISVEELLA